MSEAAISVRGLRKSYGEHEAVAGIEFEVAAGEVFGFLGPNGAGKTTTIEILEGYRERSGGEVSVFGVDPSQPTREWRNRVGLVLQECELDPLWTVREAVSLFARFYEAPRRVNETIELVGLADKRDARVATLSGGQIVVEVGRFREVANAALYGEITERTAQNLGAPRRRVDQLHQQLQRRRLAGAVGAEEAEDFSLGDLEVDPAHGFVLAIGLAQPFDADRRNAHPPKAT